MALKVGATNALPRVNGSITPSQGEDAELYDRLLKLRDTIIAGKHATFKLPESAIAELKASAARRSTQDHGNTLPQPSGAINDSAFATNQAQLQQPAPFPVFTGLPGLQSSSSQLPNGLSQTGGAKPSSNATLDPIFLEKSDSLVRAEGQLKRQRLERELQSQVDQRKHASREKDLATDAPSLIDADIVYLNALERVKPVSGLKQAGKAGSVASSFDENDYYSSQAQSEWSSESGSSNDAEQGVGAFTADFERLDSGAASTKFHKKRHSNGRAFPIPGSSAAQPAEIDSQDDEYEPGEVVEIEDEDDDYTPPDAAAFDSSRDYAGHAKATVETPDDDNSDYEPGEIMDSNLVTPSQGSKQPAAQKSPNVPIVRNHLTHLAAPQPNRVSPLATAKSQTIELELVNGRPEVVQKPVPRSNYPYSRANSASPSGNNVNGSAKKRRSKKRKRDQEPLKQTKRRRERPDPLYEQYQDMYIKDEPVSPPPFANVPEAPAPQYQPQYVQQRPADLDLTYARPAPQYQYAREPSRSGLRYEHTQPATPTVVRIASPASPSYRPVQRDTQDLRRVASLHHAQRPPSPRAYSPAPAQRTVSMTYGEPRGQLALQPENNLPYGSPAQYPRAERSRSPPQAQEYRGHYAERAASPAMMPPPPPVPQRQVIVDRYGNRFYLEEPTQPPAAMPAPRASAAPPERRIHSEMLREVAPSRNSTTYGSYDPADPRMAPPPPPSRRTAAPEAPPSYTDSNSYSTRGYTVRPADPQPPRYAPAPTSPIYQEIRGSYESMPPPPAPPPAASAREPTSPVYVSHRSYSTRPEEAQQQVPASYMRHASVAPPSQYVRQDAPAPAPQQQAMRAVSVMPGMEYSGPAQQQQFSQQQPLQQPLSQLSQQRPFVQAPQNVRYVDANGNEVFPSQVRQVGEFRY